MEQSRLVKLSDSEQQVATAFASQMLREFDGQLVSAVLFGSRARGEAVPDSDMDVVVVMSSVNLETRREIHDIAADVWLEFGIFLSILVRSRAQWHRLEELQTQLYQNICRDGIDILELAA
jgi:predicted nucleotidyltransferase